MTKMEERLKVIAVMVKAKLSRKPEDELRILVRIKNWADELEAEMKEKTAPLMEKVNEIRLEYGEMIKALAELEVKHKEHIIGAGLPDEYETTGLGKYMVKWPWTYNIDSPADVPHEYCEPARGKIWAAISKQAVREIPGVLIHQKPIVEVRRG